MYDLNEHGMIRLPFKMEMVALIIVPFEELMKLPGLGSVLRIVQMLTLVVAVYENHIIKINRKKDSTDIPLILFYVYMVISFIWCFNRTLYIDRLITYTLYFFLIFALKNLVPSAPEVNGLLKSAYLSGIFSAAIVIIGLRAGFLMNMGDRYTIELFGRHADPNVLSCSMVISIIICFYSIMVKRKKIIANIISMVLQGYGIVILGSRSGIISLLVAITIIICFMPYSGNKTIKRGIIFLLFTILVLAVGSEMSGTELGGRFSFENMIGRGELGSANRFQIWKYAISQFLQRPLLGYGNSASPYAIAQVYAFYATHNTMLMVLLEFGILGFSLYFFWMLNLCRKVFMTNLMLFAILISIFVQGIFLEQFSTKIFWCVMVLLHICISGQESLKEYGGGKD